MGSQDEVWPAVGHSGESAGRGSALITPCDSRGLRFQAAPHGAAAELFVRLYL